MGPKDTIKEPLEGPSIYLGCLNPVLKTDALELALNFRTLNPKPITLTHKLSSGFRVLAGGLGYNGLVSVWCLRIPIALWDLGSLSSRVGLGLRV